MLDMIEKLINEYGSSTILKERLELFNDKYEALEVKLANATKENELLQKENQQLKGKVQELEAQIEKAAPAKDGLPEEQVNILRMLFSTTEYVSEEYVAHHMSLEIGVAKYHLNELLEKELLNHPSYTMDNPLTGSSGTVEHSISDLGRKHVVEVLGT